MKQKFLIVLLTLACTLCLAFGLSACNSNKSHTHTQASAVKENIVAATCTENGSYDRVIYCSTCGEEISRTTRVIEATGHTEATAVTEHENPATCTEDGSYDSVIYCSICGEEIARTTKVIIATGHTKATAVTENEISATCTEGGSYESVVYCSVCNEEINRKLITIPKTEHSYGAYTYNNDQHWQMCSICNTVSNSESHSFSNNICKVCGCKKEYYQIQFAYYTDDNGDGAYDNNGAYDNEGNMVYDTYRGVTYTAVEYNGTTVDINGDTFIFGSMFAFTVKKSAYCKYTDSHNYPLVSVVYEATDGKLKNEYITPNNDGVYFVTVKGNTVITVTNVESMTMTIDGSGTESDPYTINSVVDWLYFASIINDKDWYGISYNIAYWKLTCDLDFEGEEVYIVGDGYTTSYSMFMGSFDGGGHTLSNFVITNDVYGSSDEYSMYVGLFGILSGYAGIDTTIKNLNIENYTITVSADTSSIVSVGGLVGYVAGASVVNCNVSGCKISIADEDHAAYAGGITGTIQSGYSESDGIIFYASIQYCSVDMDISGTGYLYQVGGIAGRSVPYGAISPIFIYNCYTSGLYTDAAQAGGIAGYIGRYTSVQNCYSTAEITASSSQTSYTYADTMYDYRYSYAGGIVGYAENDTVITGCFYAGGSLIASSDAGSSYAKTGNIIAAYSAAGYEDYRSEATYLANNIETTTVTDDAIKALGWNAVDWTFNGDGRPTINADSESYTFTITVKMGTESYTYTVDSLYRPMAYWYLQASQGTATALAEYLSSGTNRTYGYYFDSALTQRVPLSYVPMDNVTLYAGYANYAAVAGEYTINSNGITATLKLETDGTYELSYGNITLYGDYEYNGTYITMRDSYFSMFISTATTTQQNTYFTFWAELNSDGNLEIYDCETLFEINDTYDFYGFTYLARLVTKDNPLIAIAI